MSAGNPDSTNGVETGQYPWPHVQSPPHLANQPHLLHLQPSSYAALCSSDLNMSWALLFISLPLLKMSLPSVPLCSVSAWQNPPHPPRITTYAGFFMKPSSIALIRSCLLPLTSGMPATFYLILRGSELVLVFVSCTEGYHVSSSGWLALTVRGLFRRP